MYYRHEFTSEFYFTSDIVITIDMNSHQNFTLHVMLMYCFNTNGQSYYNVVEDITWKVA